MLKRREGKACLGFSIARAWCARLGGMRGLRAVNFGPAILMPAHAPHVEAWRPKPGMFCGLPRLHGVILCIE